MAEFTIISDTKATKSSVKDLFDFLSDFKNFASILPEDKVENFQYTGDSCSFTIRGITALTINLISKTPYNSIKFQSAGLAKFNFILEAKFIGEAEKTGECQIELFADMNPFIKVMAEKPLKGLVDTMVTRLSELQLPKA